MDPHRIQRRVARSIWGMLALCFVLCAPTVVFAQPVGSIVGELAEPYAGKQVTLVMRSSNKRFPGKIDRTSGEFRFERIELGTVCDVIVDFQDGSRREGIDLTVPPSDYEEEQPLTEEDRAALREKTLATNKFEDQVEILAIEGNIQHAVVLLNKLRTKPFYMSKPGEVVWRAELWRYERPEETWAKVQDELFTLLYRERMPKSDYDRRAITFDPRLGGLRPTAEQPLVRVAGIARPESKPGVRLAEPQDP